MTELRYNPDNGAFRITERQVCRSIARGAKRAVQNFSPSQYFQACTVDAATGAMLGSLAGPEGAAAGAAIGCISGMAKSFFSDAGVDEDVIGTVDFLINLYDIGDTVRKVAKNPIERFVVDRGL